ncbi:hypothetical protein OS493_036009 [Desmophyllum pertusum]|uniref:MYND-type domain-containing protein n=1 Tax=Desmophyllum pertusum TaxID=174260 RepID=A0A9W9ZVN7_9CNID|nr:hypothetical protein OS493_036009 [Desmophyllum pertusum]
MLKKDQCWRCDTICSSPSPKIPCSRCGVASYCSDECKHSDVFRHQVDCQTAALKRRCSGCGKEKTGLKSCGSCGQVWYCDKECQKKSWPTHKAPCQLISTKTEELSRKLKSVYDFKKRIPSLGTVYYWGNTPAVDLINLPLNEGCHYSNPLSVLACGVGDPRNVVLSLSQLPCDYKEELTFVLNDISACVMARTVLILYMLIKGGDQIASSVTQMWYSLRLSEDDHQLVISTLQELIQASSLEELTKGTMKIEQDQLHKLVQVWRTWLDLSSRKGNWITEARRRKFESDPGSQDGIDFYLKEIPKEHKESSSDWFANGILLPKVSRKGLTRENFTLTGNLDIFNRNEGPFSFTYIMNPSVIPFISWDYKDVKRFSYSASILNMYSQYVGHLLKKCAMTLATGQVKFHFLLCNCMEMTPFLPPDRKYDRVTTSNIADYVPLTSILDMSKPLLNTVNPSAVIITEFLNWHDHASLNLKKQLLFFQMVMSQSFRQKVLEDTQNPAIAYSEGRVGFMEYHDNSEELVQFLRAALLVSEVPDERNRRRTWKSVADYNGLIARNFLRCQNQVFPAKWMNNCRRVTMLSGFERAVEWIINPK